MAFKIAVGFTGLPAQYKINCYIVSRYIDKAEYIPDSQGKPNGRANDRFSV